jgi:type III pantothenate kinase
MKLLIDAGNSAAKWKLYSGQAVVGQDRFDYDEKASALQQILQQPVIEVWLAEVGSAGLKADIAALSAAHIHEIKSAPQLLGVTNSYQEPERLGVDRFLAFAEAYHLAGKTACCVIDIGTAATIDVVDDKAVHQGGHIVPGLSLLRESLLANTEKVRFEPKQSLSEGLGCSTRAAVENGTWSMLLAWVRQELAAFRQSYPDGEVYIAGGLAQPLKAQLCEPELIVVEDLVLDALYRLSLC